MSELNQEIELYVKMPPKKVRDVILQIVRNQKDTPPAYSKVVDKYFWDLV
jgi:hypothetical protein